MGPHLCDERVGSRVGLLERQHLRKPLKCVHNVGIEVPEGFAISRSEGVEPPSDQRRTGRHDGEERRERDGHRPPEDSEDGQNRDGNHHRDERRRDGVGEEVLDHLHVVRGHRHQVARAPTDEIRGSERVELFVEGDPHLGEHAEGHVVCDPRLEPVEDSCQRRGDGESHEETTERLAAPHSSHDQCAQHAHADQGCHASHPEKERGEQLGAPRTHLCEERPDRTGPPQPARSHDLVVVYPTLARGWVHRRNLIVDVVGDLVGTGHFTVGQLIGHQVVVSTTQLQQ